MAKGRETALFVSVDNAKMADIMVLSWLIPVERGIKMSSYKIEGTAGMQIPFEGKTYTLLEDIHYDLDDIFFEFTFGQSPDVIARKEFCPISLEAEIAWENPAEVAFMCWDVPYGELKEFINSGNFAENIDGILSYESEEDC